MNFKNKNGRIRTREGSENDVQKLEQVFCDRGFKPIVVRDLSAKVGFILNPQDIFC